MYIYSIEFHPLAPRRGSALGRATALGLNQSAAAAAIYVSRICICIARVHPISQYHTPGEECVRCVLCADCGCVRVCVCDVCVCVCLVLGYGDGYELVNLYCCTLLVLAGRPFRIWPQHAICADKPRLSHA